MQRLWKYCLAAAAPAGFVAAPLLRSYAFFSPLTHTILALGCYVVGLVGVFLLLRYAPLEAAGPSTIARIASHQAARAAIALALVLYLGVIFHANGSFFKPETHTTAWLQASEYGMLACGMTLVIISGGIDLSVGSVLGLVAVCFALMSIHWQWSAWIAVPAALLIGLGCGTVSGVLTATFRIQPFIATLAMMAFARGLAKTVSGGRKVFTVVPLPDGGFKEVPVPEVFKTLVARVVGDTISVVTIIFLVCAAVAWFALACRRWGRQLYAVGGNEQAARLSGIRVERVRIVAYAASGLLAAVAGICHAAQERQGDPEAGIGYELTAIAMVVIGGTSLAGGTGGIGLTLIGTLTFGYLEKILSINNVPQAGRLMLTGLIIIAAVLTQRRQQ